MTIFHSKWIQTLSAVLAGIGALGFLSCFFIGALAEWRLHAHPEYARADSGRPVQITVKGLTGFVEHNYAKRLRRADELVPIFWIVALPGFFGLALARKSK